MIWLPCAATAIRTGIWTALTPAGGRLKSCCRPIRQSERTDRIYETLMAGDPAEPQPETEQKPSLQDTLLRTYRKVKAENPDHLAVIRVGDFYELFGKDAETSGRGVGAT